MVSEQQKSLIQRVVNVFETGTAEGKYHALAVYWDGFQSSAQITYGRSQTTEQGNLVRLIESYVENRGQLSEELSPYLEMIGQRQLFEDERFKALLIRAGQEDPVMRCTQDDFFDESYWQPSLIWMRQHELSTPLAHLVIYDSFIHSGRILMFLRQRFRAMPPVSGGDERSWLKAYVETRHQWLKHHSNPLLRKTIYRTQMFLDQIEEENWNLSSLPLVANGVAVT